MEYTVSAAANVNIPIKLPVTTRLIFLPYLSFELRADGRLPLSVREPESFGAFSRALLNGEFDDYLGVVIPVNQFVNRPPVHLEIVLMLEGPESVTVIAMGEEI